MSTIRESKKLLARVRSNVKILTEGGRRTNANRRLQIIHPGEPNQESNEVDRIVRVQAAAGEVEIGQGLVR